jgi:hypothetical protein
MDQQAMWDLESANAFRKKVRQLRQSIVDARNAKTERKDKLRSARKALLAADEALALVESEAENRVIPNAWMYRLSVALAARGEAAQAEENAGKAYRLAILALRRAQDEKYVQEVAHFKLYPLFDGMQPKPSPAEIPEPSPATNGHAPAHPPETGEGTMFGPGGPCGLDLADPLQLPCAKCRAPAGEKCRAPAGEKCRNYLGKGKQTCPDRGKDEVAAADPTPAGKLLPDPPEEPKAQARRVLFPEGVGQPGPWRDTPVADMAIPGSILAACVRCGLTNAGQVADWVWSDRPGIPGTSEGAASVLRELCAEVRDNRPAPAQRMPKRRRKAKEGAK